MSSSQNTNVSLTSAPIASNPAALEKGLWIAAKDGLAGRVRVFLDLGDDVHAQDSLALRSAAERGHTEVVGILLDYGADIHAKRDYALRWAACYGFEDTVRLLLERGADLHVDGDLPLRAAAANGQDAVVELMLTLGADPRAQNGAALIAAAAMGRVSTAALLILRCEYSAATLADARNEAAAGKFGAVTAMIDSALQLRALGKRSAVAAIEVPLKGRAPCQI